MAKKNQKKKNSSKFQKFGTMFSSAYDSFESVLGLQDRLGKGYEKIKDNVNNLKRKVIRSLYSFKKNVMRSMIEIILLASGVISLVVGIILLLNRYLSIEYVFLGYGAVMTVLILFIAKLK